jgi:hypothetical protein
MTPQYTGHHLTLTLPAGTVAFYFYAEPDSENPGWMIAEAEDGTEAELEVMAEGGAQYFGFYATNGVRISTLSIGTAPSNNHPADWFAVGEFGIASARRIHIPRVPLPWPSWVDPLSVLLPPSVYLAWVEAHHPNTPTTQDLHAILEAMTIEQRSVALSRARTLGAYAQAVETALATIDAAAESQAGDTAFSNSRDRLHPRSRDQAT